MRSWYRLELGDGVTAEEPAERLRKSFLSTVAVSVVPGPMALFIRRDSSQSLHCRVTAYFPPATAELAEQAGAVPCPKPRRQGLELLAGDPACLRLLFDNTPG